MSQLGVEKLFVEKASGRNTARRELQSMLKFVREGDTVIVESYSRLARSTRDLLDIGETLKEKRVDFISKKESIDTTSAAGRLMLTIFAGLYQFEVDSLKDRQAEGIRIAKKAGKYKGRKPIEIDRTKLIALYSDCRAGKITAVSAHKQLNITPQTFYRRVRMYEEGSFV
jgi:DNA invertase Pin-like site-specific DNA recombinase